MAGVESFEDAELLVATQHKNQFKLMTVVKVDKSALNNMGRVFLEDNLKALRDMHIKILKLIEHQILSKKGDIFGRLAKLSIDNPREVLQSDAVNIIEIVIQIVSYLRDSVVIYYH